MINSKQQKNRTPRQLVCVNSNRRNNDELGNRQKQQHQRYQEEWPVQPEDSLAVRIDFSVIKECRLLWMSLQDLSLKLSAGDDLNQTENKHRMVMVRDWIPHCNTGIFTTVLVPSSDDDCDECRIKRPFILLPCLSLSSSSSRSSSM